MHIEETCTFHFTCNILYIVNDEFLITLILNWRLIQWFGLDQA